LRSGQYPLVVGSRAGEQHGRVLKQHPHEVARPTTREQAAFERVEAARRARDIIAATCGPADDLRIEGVARHDPSLPKTPPGGMRRE
jgi:hypothetical protein